MSDEIEDLKKAYSDAEQWVQECLKEFMRAKDKLKAAQDDRDTVSRVLTRAMVDEIEKVEREKP